MKYLKIAPAAVLILLMIFTATPAQPYEALADPNTPLAKAYSDFMKAWISKPEDFKALSEKYGPILKAYVKEADAKFQTSLDKEITAALAEGAAGKNLSANRQVAQKGIQNAFIAFFINSLKKVAQLKSTGDDLAKIDRSAAIIKSIAGRRDQWLAKGMEYSDSFASALNDLHTSLKKGDLNGAAGHAAQLEAFTYKMILFSTLYELGGLEKARGSDDEAVAAKTVEANYYYRILNAEHQSRNAKGAVMVSQILREDPLSMDVELAQKILAEDFKSELTGLDKGKLGI